MIGFYIACLTCGFSIGAANNNITRIVFAVLLAVNFYFAIKEAKQ